MTTVILTALLILGATSLLEKWRSREQWKHGNWITLPLWWLPATAVVSLMLVASGFWVGGRWSDAGRVVFAVDSIVGCSVQQMHRLNHELGQWTDLYLPVPTVARDTTPEVETP